MSLIKKYKKTLIFIVGSLIVGVLVFHMGKSQSAEQQEESAELDVESVLVQDEAHSEVNTNLEEVSSAQTQSVYVDIKGAVEVPGVYEMQASQRVIDVIQKAGGLREDSDSNMINFAKQLEDEMMIYIPRVGEEVLVELPLNQESPNQTTININQAETNDLLSLNGIGPQKAQQIIVYRETNGPFKTIEDITKVSGIGEKTFEKIQEQITVD